MLKNKKVLPDANDFKNIETLKNKYVTNWNELPKQLQDFILSCDRYYMINVQEILLYKDNKIVSSIGTTRYYSETEVASIGAGDLFQWNSKEGFTVNNL